jgi:hypothetical protein
VFNRVSTKLIGVLAGCVLAASAWAQAPAAKPPAVKDQGEYDLTQAIQKEADPQKKLDLLNQWEQKYPDSDFKSGRSVMTAQTLGLIAAKALQPNASPTDMDAAQKAAQSLVDNMDKYLAAANKPATVTDQQWTDAKSTMTLQAHTVLSTAAMSKKTPEGDAAAEAEFKKTLELSPGSAAAAYQLGVLILRERKVNRIPEALYYIARSISITGPMALNAQGKKAADDYLKKAYEGYHGADDGLEDLKKAAAASPNPPADFTIKSVTDIEAAKAGDEAAFNAANPDTALWRTLRTALTAADGDTYFGQIKGSEVPPQAEDAKFKMFRGKVISQPSPKDLLVNVDSVAGDATLTFEAPLKGTIEPGTAIKFKGVVDAFVKDPYMLTFAGLAKEDVDGLPASAFTAAPARRRPPVTKKK